MLCHALDATGLKDYRVGLGDASLFPALMASLSVPEEARDGLLEALVRRDFVGLERALEQSGLADEAIELLLEVPQRRGGPEVLADTPGLAEQAVTGLRRVHELLEPSVAARVIFDLGLVRNIGYYTGAVFDVYDPALGAPIGGGGRYDELLGRFGRGMPAVGFALGVERLHLALAGEERGTGALLLGAQDGAGDAIGHLRRARRGRRDDAGQRAHDRGPARGAVRGHDRAAGEPRPGHGGAALERPQAAVRGRRRDHDAPLGRADLRRGGRGGSRRDGQGRAAGAGRRAPGRGRTRGLRAARPRLRALHDGAGEQGRSRPGARRRCAGSA